MANKKLSNFISTMVPHFILEEHPRFVTYLRKYVEYLERDSDIIDFTISAVYQGNYDPGQTGKTIAGKYLLLTSNYTPSNNYAETQDYLQLLKNKFLRIDQNIYAVEDIVYSISDDAWLVEIADGTGILVGETACLVDIGEYTLISDLLLNRDPDAVAAEFVEFHNKEFLFGLPNNFEAEISLVLKKIRDFYISKGSEESYRFFFRAIFNAEIEFYYPKVDILRASGSKWYQPWLITSAVTTNFPLVVGKTVIGQTSNARGAVERISFDGGQVLEVVATSGTFQLGETIQLENDDSITVVIDTLTLATGRWLNKVGHLSGTSKLQDNWYYQDFSYVIRTNIPVSNYEDLVLNVLHPAGLKFFAEFVEEDFAQYDIQVAIASSNMRFNYNVDLGGVQVLVIPSVSLDISNLYEFDPTITVRYFDENKESEPLASTYTIGDIDDFPIDWFEDNPDKYWNYLPSPELTITP